MGTKTYFNGVKGTGPLAEGSEGRQSLPFFDKAPSRNNELQIDRKCYMIYLNFRNIGV